ncbi:MAG TPA: SAM-dependent methyltransferase [Ignavibacteriaceae bacterium]
MSDFNSEFWDERFSVEEYIYGIEPNQFFKGQLNKIRSRGKILLPGEGEGRNAIYAAKLGWTVDAFDQSLVAKIKALKLAEANKVKINYSNIDLGEFNPQKNIYDCTAIIFVHLAPDFRSEFHKKIIDSIKPNGKIILELFSRNQFGKDSGGPKDLTMLSSIKEIENDFKKMRIILLEEKNIYLDEGEKHSGLASVIRFVGEKIV